MKTVEAYAKVNLGLDVIGTREDGYHLVRLVMQTIDLHDTLMFKEAHEGVSLSIMAETKEKGGKELDVSSLPSDGRNLCVKAARLLMEDAKVDRGVDITLVKRVPFEAGLGGGSADAAAVLNGLNEWWELGYAKERLAALGLKVGADVPYLVYGGSMLAEGIGERLTPLSFAHAGMRVLLAKPSFGAATGEIYGAFDACSDPIHPDIDQLIETMAGISKEDFCASLGNALEAVTAAKHPLIKDLEKEMKKAGALAAMMTGSGPTVFGLFDDETTMKEAYQLISVAYPECLLFESHLR